MACESLTRQTRDEENLKPILVPKLAAKAFHLPDYTWFEDLVQYHLNTNPVLGIFMHHPFHPVSRLERLIILLGDLAFGLFGTFLVFSFNDQAAYKERLEELSQIAQIPVGEAFLDPTAAIDDRDAFVKTLVAAGQVYGYLFMVGVLQSIFVAVLWQLQACTCFNHGGCLYSSERIDTNRRCSYFANFSAFVLVLIIVSLTVVSGLITCGDITPTDEYNTTDGLLEFLNDEGECTFTNVLFWKLYGVGFAMSTATEFVVTTVKFTGVLSYLFCDKAVCMKFFGGRRAEMRAEQEHQQIKQTKTQEEEDAQN